MSRLIRRNKYISLFWSIVFVWIGLICSTGTTTVPAPNICPIGFTEVKVKNDPYPQCYRLKEPEKFDDKFVDCAGNNNSFDLLQRLIFKQKPDYQLWIELKSVYPGGFFVEWSYSNYTGNIMHNETVFYSSSFGIEQDLCLVWNPRRGHERPSLARCTDTYRRLCIIDGYKPIKPDESNFLRFKHPRVTDLTMVEGVRSAAVRATWSQAQALCALRNATLLQRGWRYANHLQLQSATGSRHLPLGIFMSINDKLLWSQPEDGVAEVPDTEYSFRDERRFSVETSLLALTGDFWHLVNNSSIFYTVICERPVFLSEEILNVTQTGLGKLVVRTNNVLVEKPLCFTDSEIFSQVNPEAIEVTPSLRIGVVQTGLYEFSLIPKSDGYYWCIAAGSENYLASESNKHLYIREKESIRTVYAIKVKGKKQFSFDKLNAVLKLWMTKLSEFIFLRTNYLNIYGEFNVTSPYEVQNILKRTKAGKIGVYDEAKIFRNSKIKRVYMDRMTMLIHTEMSPEMEPLMPGFWENLEVLFMRPTYYCKSLSSVPPLALGESTRVYGCKTYSCVGDFNEGVQLVETVTTSCTSTVPAPREITTSIPLSIPEPEIPLISTATPIWNATESTTTLATTDCDNGTETTTSSYTDLSTLTKRETTPYIPTTTERVSTATFPTTTMKMTEDSSEEVTDVPIRPPQEHVQDVLDHLDNLLQREVIQVDDVKGAFDEVDNMLDIEDNVEIPGQFLTMVDNLGARANLNGSRQAAVVRRNVALLFADTSAEEPVMGVRIASRENDTFYDQAFGFLSGNRNESHLNSNSSEALVYLPTSVSSAMNRISFVVFRDQRPFLPAPGYQHYNVNSRVLSINVHNNTHNISQFDANEYIDIHLRPWTDILDRNVTRTCAYWQFLNNGTGRWTREGCIFIPATAEGLLDTCRCTHLTHFAEVLVPIPVFAEKHEKTLEYLSIIGCCLSLFGLFMVGLTAILFRSWRRDFNNKIWLNLCVAILILIICFLVIVFAHYQEYTLGCMFNGIFLHYAVVCSFCWMLVAAVISYRRLVLVFTRDASHKLFRACAFAYGVPCIILGILLSVNPHSFKGRFDENNPNGSFCYPSGLALYLSLYAPVAVMLIANVVLFIIIVRSVFANNPMSGYRQGDKNEAVRCASVSFLLVFLFGLPWIFGLFAHLLVFSYLFALTATYQGLILFIFFVVGNKKTRELWMNKLKIKQTRKVPVTSSTGYRGAASTVTIEGNSSKPRSLANTNDESRFS